MLAQPVRSLIRLVDGNIISTRNGMDGKFRLLESPTLLTRGALGKNHILLRLVDIEAKKFFFVNTNVVPRKAFNNCAMRPKIDALHTMGVEALGDRIPRLATLLDGGGQAVFVRARGSTINQ